MKVKFAHVSDCHLGAWRNDNLNNIGYLAFTKAVDKIISEQVDFVILSGDLFDVSNPRVDVVDLSIKELKKLKDNDIPVYGIMGSHDFSPSGKTMIRPLITAGLYVNLSKGKDAENNKLKLKFTVDKKTEVKLTGIRARKRSLEIEDYENLDRESIQNVEGVKIFVLHTMLSELKPIEYKDMKSAPKSLLPQGFDYYAGGHLHKTVPQKLKEDSSPIALDSNNNIIYPGCLYPTNFRELEQYQNGGFCIVSGEVDHQTHTSELKVQYIPVKVKDVLTLTLDCNNKTTSEAIDYIEQKISQSDVIEKIVTLRIIGTLTSGKPYEIKTSDIKQNIMEKGAYEVLINKSALISKEYASISVVVGKTNEEIEATLINEHAEQATIKKLSVEQIKTKTHALLDAIGVEREEETQVNAYKKDILQKFLHIFDLKEGET